MSIDNRTELYKRLSDVVVSGLPLSNETLNDVMSFVIQNDIKHQEAIDKWIKNCDKLMEKLSENK